MACRRSVPEACRRLFVVALMLVGLPAGGGENRQLGGIPGGSRLAATANGQAVRCLDGDRGRIVSFEPDRPAARRDVVGPLAGARFVAVGCLPGDLVVTVCQAGDAWWLRSYRVEPGLTADAAAPLQEIALGTADATDAAVAIAVSSARGWLAIVGLPPPLPPVLRAAVAGVRIGPLSDRMCPELPAGYRPLAATVSPRDELVLALATEPDAAHPGQADRLAFYDLAGRERAAFDSGLTAVRGVAFDRRGETLCVVGQRAGAPETGLWRLDARLDAGRQVIRPALLAPAAAPRDLVAVAERTFIMLTSDPAGTLVQVDPTATIREPSIDPGDLPP